MKRNAPRIKRNCFAAPTARESACLHQWMIEEKVLDNMFLQPAVCLAAGAAHVPIPSALMQRELNSGSRA